MEYISCIIFILQKLRVLERNWYNQSMPDYKIWSILTTKVIYVSTYLRMKYIRIGLSPITQFFAVTLLKRNMGTELAIPKSVISIDRVQIESSLRRRKVINPPSRLTCCYSRVYVNPCLGHKLGSVITQLTVSGNSRVWIEYTILLNY